MSCVTDIEGTIHELTLIILLSVLVLLNNLVWNFSKNLINVLYDQKNGGLNIFLQIQIIKPIKKLL